MPDRYATRTRPLPDLDRLFSLVEGAGFWTAVALPPCYLLLFLTGPPSVPLLVGLLALNAVALVAGHGYPRS